MKRKKCLISFQEQNYYLEKRQWKNLKIPELLYLYLLGISGAGIDADSQVEKPMRLQVKE